MASNDFDVMVGLHNGAVDPSPTPYDCTATEVHDVEAGFVPQDRSQSVLTESDDAVQGYKIPAVGYSNNILLLYQLHHLRVQYWVNFFLSVVCLLLVGINIMLIVLNSLDIEILDTMRGVYHGLEFWSTFVASLVDLLALSFSPKPLRSIYYKPVVLKILVATSVTVSFVPALLISIDKELFEFACHNTEYSAEVVMAIIDGILFMSLFKTPGFSFRGSMMWLALAMLSLSLGITNLAVYNLIEGEEGEHIVHYIEFTFNIINSGTMFWFCSDNRFLVEQWIASIMAPQEGLALSTETASKKQ